MKKRMFVLSFVGLVWLTFCVLAEARPLHPWLGKRRHVSQQWLKNRIAPPAGFRRVKARRGSFSWWLRRLPLMAAGTPVRDYRGRRIASSSHVAVVRLDVGRGNLQQCADSIMRLWGEYLWSRGLQRHYQFRLTSGHRNPWLRYARGSDCESSVEGCGAGVAKPPHETVLIGAFGVIFEPS